MICGDDRCRPGSVVRVRVGCQAIGSRRADIEAIKKTVFFVTRIGKEDSIERIRSDDLMDLLLVPVVRELDPGLTVIRGDKMSPVGRITDNIVHHLIYSAVIVADTTGRNPNVFYEVGVAHAFRRPIVLIVDDADAIPFDIHSEGHLVLPGEGSLLGRTIESNKTTLLTALRVALASTTPQGPVAAAEAQLTPTSLTADQATDILRSQLADLGYRLDAVESGFVSHTSAASHRTFADTILSGRRAKITALSAHESEFLRGTLLGLLKTSRQVKETRGLNVSGEEVIIDYIGSDLNPRQYRVEAKHGQLQKTLSAVLLEFGLYDQLHEDVEYELREAGLT